MKILVKITRDILKQTKMCGLVEGQLHAPKSCAFAVAFREIFPNARIYLPDLLPFGVDDIMSTIEVPDDMCRFIGKFDRATPEERVKLPEQSFEIDVPDSVTEKIGLEEVKKILSVSESLEYIQV